MALPPTVVAAVERHLATVREDWRGHPFDVGELAARHQLLPLVPEMFGLVALRRDGTVVELAWDSEEVRPVLAPKMRDVALLLGARRYHELSVLLPERPVDARVCGECRGVDVAPSVTCECGGLGWIPETWG
ncbi:MAG: hypothetical protein L0Y66_12910 [Myxococcaceae bacterium]|nr:hypothetical protein [Myxococcaceae bacterium]